MPEPIESETGYNIHIVETADLESTFSALGPNPVEVSTPTMDMIQTMGWGILQFWGHQIKRLQDMRERLTNEDASRYSQTPPAI